MTIWPNTHMQFQSIVLQQQLHVLVMVCVVYSDLVKWLQGGLTSCNHVQLC